MASEPPATTAGAAPAASGPLSDRRFFGHPRGLATLFLTEFWERFSYYGMRGLLILFMTADGVRGGLGFSTPRAGAIYGLYTGSVWLASLPGGWIADRLLGQRRAVFIGGCVIAAGHFCLAVDSLATFFLGLVLIASGTGLLKPNVSTMVGELYPEGGGRRDAGFSIFYSGINLGALAAPLVCGELGEKVNWHLGFAMAGVGMVLGLIQYKAGGRHLGEAGLRPNAGVDPAARRKAVRTLVGGAAAALLVGGLIASGVIGLTAERAAQGASLAIGALGALYFAFQFLFGGLDRRETKRMLALLVLFVFSAVFWAGFEQAGSSLNLFAEQLTNRNVLGWHPAASTFQSVEPLFVIVFAPVLAWLWVRLGRRNPSSPFKFSLGLFLGALGLVVVVFAALASVGTAVFRPGIEPRLVGPMWLVVTYLLQGLGELCLSPVGLSTVTKLAPRRKVSQLMGIWFLSLSLGNLLAGQVAGRFDSVPLFQIFGAVAAVTAGAGLLMLLLVRPMRNLMQGAE
ncbi:MAG TPA: peptide MFS transporter [Thermoanaerobaculia bacterium]|nr:peptide MFS transporter [Thermoanaerobaculia bacterium]